MKERYLLQMFIIGVHGKQRPLIKHTIKTYKPMTLIINNNALNSINVYLPSCLALWWVICFFQYGFSSKFWHEFRTANVTIYIKHCVLFVSCTYRWSMGEFLGVAILVASGTYGDHLPSVVMVYFGDMWTQRQNASGRQKHQTQPRGPVVIAGITPKYNWAIN